MAEKWLREVIKCIKGINAFILAVALENNCIPKNCIKGLPSCLPFTAQERMSGCPTHTYIAVRTPSVSSYHWVSEWEYVRVGEPLFSSEDGFCQPAPVPTACAVAVGLARRKFHGKSPARVSDSITDSRAVCWILIRDHLGLGCVSHLVWWLLKKKMLLCQLPNSSLQIL